jgi:tRNA pseudouridine38-40 synthase
MYFVYKMTIAYDGTGYGGWQSQNNAPSIQTLVQDALSILLRMRTTLQASGRTDAGVHALGQVAHFKHPAILYPSKILYSLNALLPLDIRILALELAPAHFQARFSALSKIYHYYLYLGSARDPFQRLYTYRPPYPIDRDLLAQAAAHFVGTRDFTSFANSKKTNKAKGLLSLRAPSEIAIQKRSSIRTIYNLSLLEKQPFGQGNKDILCLSFEGNGFLYKMVRNIAGAMLRVASGKMALEEIPRIFAARDRREAPAAAPPYALFLSCVNYPNSASGSEREERSFGEAEAEDLEREEQKIHGLAAVE